MTRGPGSGPRKNLSCGQARKARKRLSRGQGRQGAGGDAARWTGSAECAILSPGRRSFGSSGQALRSLRTSLGTTSLVLDDQGNRIAESRHYPYGGERWRWPAGGAFPTEYRFTGQRLDGLGLYHMGVRWYDSYINQFVQPDTIIPQPGNPQNLNRYSYCLGNSLK